MFLVGQVGTSIPCTAKNIPFVKKKKFLFNTILQNRKFDFFNIKLTVSKDIFDLVM